MSDIQYQHSKVGAEPAPTNNYIPDTNTSDGESDFQAIVEDMRTPGSARTLFPERVGTTPDQAAPSAPSSHRKVTRRGVVKSIVAAALGGSKAVKVVEALVTTGAAGDAIYEGQKSAEVARELSESELIMATGLSESARINCRSAASLMRLNGTDPDKFPDVVPEDGLLNKIAGEIIINPDLNQDRLAALQYAHTKLSAERVNADLTEAGTASNQMDFFAAAGLANLVNNAKTDPDWMMYSARLDAVRGCLGDLPNYAPLTDNITGEPTATADLLLGRIQLLGMQADANIVETDSPVILPYPRLHDALNVLAASVQGIEAAVLESYRPYSARIQTQ